MRRGLTSTWITIKLIQQFGTFLKKASMRLKSAAAPLALTCSILFSGCTFRFLQGNGPSDKDKVATHIPSATPQQIEEWKKEVYSFGSPLGLGRSRTTPFGRYKCYKQDYSSSGSFTSGKTTTRLLFTPTDPDSSKRTLLGIMGSFGYTLIDYRYESRWYDYPSGECFSSSQLTWHTLLYVRLENSTYPDGTVGNFFPPDVLDKSKQLNAVKYHHMSGTCLALGIIAWGEKNDRAYFQLAWIPIPLWSTK